MSKLCRRSIIHDRLDNRAFRGIVGRVDLRFTVQHIEHGAVAVRDTQLYLMLALAERLSMAVSRSSMPSPLFAEIFTPSSAG